MERGIGKRFVTVALRALLAVLVCLVCLGGADALSPRLEAGAPTVADDLDLPAPFVRTTSRAEAEALSPPPPRAVAVPVTGRSLFARAADAATATRHTPLRL